MTNNVKRAIDTDLCGLHTTERERAVIYQSVLEGYTVPKKLSAAFVITIILVLLAAAALAVTALTGNLRFMKPEEGPQALSCTVMDDTLYIMTNRGLMAWQPTQEEPVSLQDDQRVIARGLSIDSLLFCSDELMILNPRTMAVFRYHNGAIIKALQLNTTADTFSNCYLSDPVAMDGSLFIRAIESDKSDAEAVLWRFDLVTGEAETLPIPSIVSLSAYREGELLGVQFDIEAGIQTILSIDAQSGEVLERIVSAPVMEIKGVAYDVDNNAIYAIRSGTLSRWKNGQWMPLQTVSIPRPSFYFGTLSSGYVAASYSGIQFISFDAEETGPTLVIRGWSALPGAEDAFVQANPGVQIKRETMARFGGTDIAEALQTGDAVDLFHVRLDAAVAALVRDGQLAPLSQSACITADIAQMLTQVQAAVAPSGTPYALPSMLQIPMWMIRSDATTPPPRTLAELLSQDIAWNAQPHAGSMYLANDYNTVPWSKESYSRYALQQAYEEAAAIGQIPDFSAEYFTSFLAALKSATLAAVEQPLRSSIITANSYFMLRGRTRDDAWLQWRIMDPPAVTAVEADTIPASLLVYVVNPQSKNMDLALSFLTYAAQHRIAEEQALLCPDTAEPSLYAYAQGYEGLEALPDSWEVSADALSTYKAEIVPRLSVSFYPYSPNQALMIETVMQYLNDGFTLEQCTERLNALAAGKVTE